MQLVVIAGGTLAGIMLKQKFLSVTKPASASTAHPRFAGLSWLVAFFALLLILPLAARLWPLQWLQIVDGFYRTGALVFGGGHVILPLLEQATVGRGWLDHDTFLAGYGAAQALPGPAVELNYGVLPDTQLHLIVPMTTVGGDGVPTVSGLGDTEFGIKYRFLHETNWWPQIGIFPMAELPTGDSSRGLGNGRTWFRLPLWAQKSWGPWATYGGGGAALNSAPGQRNYPFGGWLVQRDFGPHLTLGGEIFAQGQDTDNDKGFAALNFGGSYNVNEHFSLLFSAEHSVAGDDHTL